MVPASTVHLTVVRPALTTALDGPASAAVTCGTGIGAGWVVVVVVVVDELVVVGGPAAGASTRAVWALVTLSEPARFFAVSMTLIV
jgi:hypothetical protein